MTVKCEDCGALKYLDEGVDPATVPCTCGAALKPVPVTLPDRAGPDGSRIRAIGRYELKRTLGRGGMGEVLLAYDPKLDRDVALKVLHSASAASAEDLTRFQQEARTAAQLQHPNIVPTFDFGEVDGIHYLTQEFVDGRSLDTVIDEAPISPRRAMEILALLAGAVQHAHEQGVIHRDLKPANVLVAADGTPRLTDFGLARRLGQSQLTKTGTVMGTPAYMPPEQAQGDMSQVDARSDVYGLGALLYELLVLAPPFEADSPMQVLYQVVRNDPVPPAQRDHRIAAEISAICMKCLEKRPADRYQSAAELAEDCRRYLDGEPVRAKPAGLLKRTWRRAQRNKAVVGTGVAALLLLAGGVGGVYYHYAVRPALEAEAARRASEAERARTLAAGERQLGDAQAALANQRPAEAAALARRALATFGSLTPAPPEPVSNAHLLLADVARANDRTVDVRQSLFQAFHAVLGAPEEHRQLARIGHRLFANRDIGLARQIFEHVLVRTTPDPATAFEAKLGIAKCTAAWGEFEQARNHFAGLAESPGDSPDAAAEIRTWRALLDALAPRRRLPVKLEACRIADLDGDGTREVAVLDGGTVRIGRIAGGEWTELAAAAPFPEGVEPHPLTGLHAADLDGDGAAELCIAGGDPQARHGSVIVAGWDGAALRVRSRVPMISNTCAQPFAVADLRGDGRPQLVLVTRFYGRSVWVYDYTRDGGLRVAHRMQLGTDFEGVLAADLDGNGRDEVWALGGSYGGYNNSLLRLTWNAAADRFDVEARPMASAYHLDPARRPGEEDVLLATGWRHDAAAFNLIRYGREGFRTRYLAEGAYFLRMEAPWPTLRPLVQQPWPEQLRLKGDAPTAGRIRTGEREFAWVYLEPAEAPARGEPYRVRIYARDPAAPEAWSFFSEVQTWDRAIARAQPRDLDGDGDDELVAGRMVYGLGPAPAPKSLQPTADTATAELPPPSRASAALRAAREASRLGVLAEAERLYRAEVLAPASRESLEEAAQGLVESLLQGRRLQEAAKEAHSLIDRYPLLLRTVGDRVREALVRDGEWEAAAGMARRQLRHGGQPPRTRAALEEVLRQAQALRRMRPAVDASNCAAPETDLLATNPWLAVLTPEGGMRLRWCGQRSGQAVLLPITPPNGSARLHAEWTVHRQDWHTRYDVQVVTGDAWRLVPGKPADWAPGGTDARRLLGLHAEAKGSSEVPGVYVDLTTERTYPLARSPLPADAPFSLTMEYAAQHDTLRADLDHPRAGRVTLGVRRARVEWAGPAFLVWRGYGGANALGYWGDLTVRRLAIAARAGALEPARFVPSEPVEHLWLAHGRWIQGRLDEAMAGYDRAVSAAGDDRSWVGVDARFWRAMLRAHRGGQDAAARQDLAEASRRSPQRFRDLIVGSALPLQERERESKLLAAMLLPASGTAAGPAFGNWLEKRFGLPAMLALLPGAGQEVRRVLRVRRTERAGAPEPAASELRPGDVILSYAGAPAADQWAFARQQDAARSAGRPVEVVVQRGGGRVTCTIDPTAVWIVTEARVFVSPR